MTKKQILLFAFATTLLFGNFQFVYADQPNNTSCGNKYAAAIFPKILPPLDKSACPSSNNTGKANTIINQLYWKRSGNLQNFGKSYMLALKKNGWHIDKLVNGNYKLMPAAQYYSLTATHSGNLTLKFGCTNIARQPHTFDNNAKGPVDEGFDISVVLTKK